METKVETGLQILSLPTDALYLPSDPRAYPAFVYTSGDDIIVPLAWATAFGGPDDEDDDGSTASGQRTDIPGGLACCALPLPYDHPCRGTAFPNLPWGTLVRVQSKGRAISIPLLDVGPGRALESKALIDMTLPAWRLLTGNPNLPDDMVNELGQWVSIVIPGGVEHIGSYTPVGVRGGVLV